LKYIARLNSIPENKADMLIDEALFTVGLVDQSDTKVSKFSRGMKQRLGIANVLFKRPKVAFLDEPTQGIDPKGVYEMLDLFIHMNKEEGVTILLSSHLIHQVQQICDHVGIMVGGRMVVRGAVEDLDLERGQKWLIEIEARGVTKRIIEEISDIRGVKSIERSGDIMVAECDMDLRSEISAAIVRGKASLLGLSVKERSLDEIYRRYSEEG
jgi:ABC-2 type transport system ATP-binding protein